MLTISPLSRPITKDEVDITSFSDLEDQFADFPEFEAPAGCLLDSIDFDMLPDLEMDPPDFMADFSFSAGDVIDYGEDDFDTGIQVVPDCYNNDNMGHGANGSIKSDESEKSTSSSTQSGKERDKSKKLSSSQSKKSNRSNEGKRKTKVDWTPDLHRRFVQAVEQLGVNKAVPSRILELMGIHCLTRHNVASHLQKYRSHRKHLLAREAEAASWSQKRQMYGIAVIPAGSAGGGGNPKINPRWHSPTIGFPPMTPAPPPMHHHHHPFRPLHVWGHPTTHHVEPQTVIPIWPKQPTPTFWHPHHEHVPNVVTTPTSCFPQTLPATRFATAPPVPGVPPPHAAMYKDQRNSSSSQSHPHHPLIDLQPTKESIDAVLGDILRKPWLPLPIGLKPPSMDSVMVELHRKGVSKIPPT